MDHLKPDPSVIEAFKKGDPKTFDSFFRSFYPHLCYFASQLIGDSPEVEDIVKDSFVKLWRKHADFDSVGGIKSFLYVTTRNDCISSLRHRRVKNTFREEMVYLQESRRDELILHRLIRAELMQEIYEEIRQLPDKRREVLQMAYLEGMKNDEIAQRLNISVYTVKVHKVKALSFLRVRFSGRKSMLMFLAFLHFMTL
jgi:RNA polymerase sigma-70 factor (family 1)